MTLRTRRQTPGAQGMHCKNFLARPQEALPGDHAKRRVPGIEIGVPAFSGSPHAEQCATSNFSATAQARPTPPILAASLPRPCGILPLSSVVSDSRSHPPIMPQCRLTKCPVMAWSAPRHLDDPGPTTRVHSVFELFDLPGPRRTLGGGGGGGRAQRRARLAFGLFYLLLLPRRRGAPCTPLSLHGLPRRRIPAAAAAAACRRPPRCTIRSLRAKLVALPMAYRPRRGRAVGGSRGA